jgi:hypothetical protein
MVDFIKIFWHGGRFLGQDRMWLCYHMPFFHIKNWFTVSSNWQNTNMNAWNVLEIHPLSTQFLDSLHNASSLGDKAQLAWTCNVKKLKVSSRSSILEALSNGGPKHLNRNMLHLQGNGHWGLGPRDFRGLQCSRNHWGSFLKTGTSPFPWVGKK